MLSTIEWDTGDAAEDRDVATERAIGSLLLSRGGRGWGETAFSQE